MQIHVELFGIPRRRAGTQHAAVDLPGPAICLGEALQALARQYPELSPECIDGDRLADGCVANLGGVQFIRDPHTPLPWGVPLLILSADAGG